MKIEVVVHPNARKPRINAPPLEGKANIAVIEALAEFFKTKKNKEKLIIK